MLNAFRNAGRSRTSTQPASTRKLGLLWDRADTESARARPATGDGRTARASRTRHTRHQRAATAPRRPHNSAAASNRIDSRRVHVARMSTTQTGTRPARRVCSWNRPFERRPAGYEDSASTGIRRTASRPRPSIAAARGIDRCTSSQHVHHRFARERAYAAPAPVRRPGSAPPESARKYARSSAADEQALARGKDTIRSRGCSRSPAARLSWRMGWTATRKRATLSADARKLQYQRPAPLEHDVAEHARMGRCLGRQFEDDGR